MSPTKWIESTNAKGIVVKSGRYGGTYAQKNAIQQMKVLENIDDRKLLVEGK